MTWPDAQAAIETMAKNAKSEEAIFQRLREVIRTRQIAPGTRLRELQISEVLGASRGAVRKALDRLAFEGLVDLEHNRGASVARPSEKDAADLFAARKCIELAIATQAASRLTPDAINALEAHLDMERQAHLEDDADAIVLLSGEFHLLLADIAGNTALRRYLEDIIARESLIIQLFGKPGKDDCSDHEHARIATALKSGDQDRIAEEIEQHIDHIAAGLDLETRPRVERDLADILGAK